MNPDIKAREAASDISLFNTVIFYALLIILGPIMTFFVSKIIFFEGVFHASSLTSNVGAAIAAVVLLHILVGLYIYRAYAYTDTPKPKPVKVD